MNTALFRSPALSQVLWAFGVALSCVATGCSLGEGDGRVYSERLLAADCWDAEYDMKPDFFAAVAYRSTLQIRVQRGSDLQEVSDGLAVLVDDVAAVRAALPATGAGADFTVSLPAGVAPPGSLPIGVATITSGAGGAGGAGSGGSGGSGGGGTAAPATSPAPMIHMSLYLQQSCHNQNTVLYSVSGNIHFAALFNGDPNEKDAEEKYTNATFDVMMGDPRDVPLGAPGSAIPADKQTHLTGYFRFYFQRGQPAQPFP